jgi:esterase/lipase
MARRRPPNATTSSAFSGSGFLKVLRGVLIFLAIMLLTLGGVSGVITFKILSERNDTERINPDAIFQTSYVNLSFTDRMGREHDGWLLMGLKGAPAIVLCHGYDSNRSDLLVLGNLLQANHFNAYIFNFQGPKVKDKFNDLGTTQLEILQAAVGKVTQQPGVNANRVGLFGVNTGGYAALAVAQQNPLVNALVLDTIYADPRVMFDAQVDQAIGGAGDAFRIFPRTIFKLINYSKTPPAVQDSMQRLKGKPALFIQGRDSGLLAHQTEMLYNSAPDPKRLLVLDQSYPALASGTVKKEYEDQVLSFFLQNLPLRAD